MSEKLEAAMVTRFNSRAERLRSEIAQLEARYDGLFPPSVYAVLQGLKRELALMDKTA